MQTYAKRIFFVTFNIILNYCKRGKSLLQLYCEEPWFAVVEMSLKNTLKNGLPYVCSSFSNGLQ